MITCYCLKFFIIKPTNIYICNIWKMKNTIKEKSYGGNKRLTSPWRVKKKRRLLWLLYNYKIYVRLCLMKKSKTYSHINYIRWNKGFFRSFHRTQGEKIWVNFCQPPHVSTKVGVHPNVSTAITTPPNQHIQPLSLTVGGQNWDLTSNIWQKPKKTNRS